jgi:hypothetical protein
MSEKRILDEETRKKLLGYTPFSSSCSLFFTPEKFDTIEDTSLRPVFEIRAMRQEEITQLKTNSMGYSGSSSPETLTNIANLNKKLILSCVRGWTNLFDSGSGEEVLFTEDALNYLPNWLINSITDHVRKISGLTLAEDLGLK